MGIASFAKSAAIGLSVILTIWAAGAYWLLSGLAPLCGNEIIFEIASPDGKLRAVVFQRDCGATTDFSTHVALLDRTEKFEEATSSFFAADTNHGAAPAGPGGGPEIAVHWSSPKSIVVSHHPNARIIRNEGKSNGVFIQYLRGDASAGSQETPDN